MVRPTRRESRVVHVSRQTVSSRHARVTPGRTGNSLTPGPAATSIPRALCVQSSRHHNLIRINIQPSRSGNVRIVAVEVHLGPRGHLEAPDIPVLSPDAVAVRQD